MLVRYGARSGVGAMDGDQPLDEIFEDATHIDAGSGILRFSLMATLVVAVALIIAGVVLVYLGSTGDTEMSLFGNSFKSQNVGIAAMFCGAVVAVLGFRRAL